MSGPIVVIGSSNIDLIMKMDRLPKVGETITEASFMQTFGGKGANQAVSAARASSTATGGVYFVNSVGDDGHGNQILANLQREGIHTDHVHQARGAASGTALIMIGKGGQNYISVAPGANNLLRPEHLDQASHLIERAGLVVIQHEIWPETTEYAIHLASQAGRKILFNLAPPRPLSDVCYRKLYLFIANETEAAYACGQPVETEAQVAQAAEALLAKGPQAVIITLGANGCYVATHDLRQKMPAFTVPAVDTTAAGDAFCGSLAVALAEGRPLPEAVRFASAASAICVTRLGAQPSIPTRQEIERFLAQN